MLELTQTPSINLPLDHKQNSSLNIKTAEHSELNKHQRNFENLTLTMGLGNRLIILSWGLLTMLTITIPH